MGILDKLQDYFGGGVSDGTRTANNKKVIDSLTIEDDMDKFIRQDTVQTHEVNRKVHVMFKQLRQQNRAILTQMELFLDKWCQHHGPIVTHDDVTQAMELQKQVKAGKSEPGSPMVEYRDNEGNTQWRIPTENRAQAMVALVRYGESINRRAAARREEAETREMDGPLTEGWADNESFTGLPSDADFADALCKHDPSLKQYRKDLM